MKNRKTASIIMLFYVVLLFDNLHAEIFYVSPDGSDSNNGSINAPFKTIQKAANIVNPGDTVIVKDGVYMDTDGDDIIIDLNRGGTSNAWVTFKSENRYGAVLDGQNNVTKLCFNLGSFSSPNYVRIENFEIKGCEYGGIWSNAGASHIYIYGNKIHDIGREVNCNLNCAGGTCGMAGVYMSSESSDFTIDSNIIYKVGRFTGSCAPTGKFDRHDHGLYLSGDNVVIINNIFYDNTSGWHIQVSGAYADCHDWLIANNTFYNKNASGAKGHILIWGKNTNILIINNISHTPALSFVRIAGSYDDDIVTVRNNLLYNATCEVSNRDGCITHLNWTILDNIIGKDPLFIDLSNRNFHLQSNSPAIDRGVSYPERIKDADGNSISGLPDIGAYEYRGSHLHK